MPATTGTSSASRLRGFPVPNVKVASSTAPAAARSAEWGDRGYAGGGAARPLPGRTSPPPPRVAHTSSSTTTSTRLHFSVSYTLQNAQHWHDGRLPLRLHPRPFFPLQRLPPGFRPHDLRDMLEHAGCAVERVGLILDPVSRHFLNFGWATMKDVSNAEKAQGQHLL